jgi:hypothetical protein
VRLIVILIVLILTIPLHLAAIAGNDFDAPSEAVLRIARQFAGRQIIGPELAVTSDTMRRLVTGSCVICETTPTGCPRSRPRVSLSIYKIR